MKDEEQPETSDSESTKPKPLKAVRRYCLWCCDGSSNEASLCASTACPLWPFRFGRGPTPELLAEVADVVVYPLEQEQTGANVAGRSALKSIRARCIDCSGGSTVEANACSFTSCDLHLYRTGKSGNTRQLNEEQRAVRSNRMRELNNKRRDTSISNDHTFPAPKHEEETRSRGNRPAEAVAPTPEPVGPKRLSRT